MKRLLIVAGIALLCVGCDHISKDIAREHLATGQSKTIFGGVVSFTYAENHGGILSMGADLPANVRFWVFTIAVGVLLISMLVFAAFARGVGIIEQVSLALVVGGGLGNLVDRITHGGAVTDFLNVGVGPLRTGIFNAADVAVLTGGALLMLHAAWKVFRPSSGP